MFQLTSGPVFSDVTVTLLSSVVVLTPNGQFSGYSTFAFCERRSAAVKNGWTYATSTPLWLWFGEGQLYFLDIHSSGMLLYTA